MWCLREGGGGGGGWGGRLGVDSVRDGVLPDPLEVVDLLVIVPRLLLLLLNFKEVSQIQFIDLGVVQFLDKVGLWSRQCRKLFGSSWWFRRP